MCSINSVTLTILVNLLGPASGRALSEDWTQNKNNTLHQNTTTTSNDLTHTNGTTQEESNMDSNTAEDCSVWILWLLFCGAIVVLFAVLFTKYLSCGLKFWKTRCKIAEAHDTEAELVNLDATVADWHAFYKFKKDAGI
ncbi:hypothetical protein E8E14_012922 [Neopestalotiopsis sp. 37M]|nr:hypothetical protein E8E14_012922 [Neopestalotiopsis sp. 37M]